MLVYIEDKKLLTKIITYLDQEKIKYTTDIKDKYECAIIAQINSRTKEFIKTKKVIFIAYLEENKIYNNFNKKTKQAKIYQNNIIEFLNNCTHIVFSMESFKNIFKDKINTKISIIHKEIPKIKYTKKDTKIDKKNYIVVNDFNCENISLMIKLANIYENIFYYIGYNNLTLRQMKYYNSLPKNIIKIKQIEDETYKELVRNSYIVIDLNKDNIDIKYIQIPILYKKTLILKNIPYYEDYLIPFREIYLFSNEVDLLKKIDKIKEKRLSNVTDEAYFKISKDNFKGIASKYSLILK